MPESALNRLCVVLVSPRNPLNIGAAARAMSNFGVRRLRVVQPYDVAYREARSAVGAADVLAEAEEYADLATAVADCILVVGTTGLGTREQQHPLLPLPEAGQKIMHVLESNPDETLRVALVFGSEKYGLSTNSLSHCHWRLHIPTLPQNYSMNLGQAVAVCLYELSRCAQDASSAKIAHLANLQPPASAAELERFVSVFVEVLHAGNYASSQAGGNLQENLRRLVLRLNPSSADVEILMGMLRRVLWKLKHPQ